MKRLLLILALLSGSAFAAIANVPASATLCNQTVASAGAACTLTATTTANNVVTVKVAYKTTTRTFGDSTQPTGMSGSSTSAKFHLYGYSCNGSSECVAIWICFKCAAVTTVTPKFSGTTLYVLTVDEYSGVGSIGISAQATGSSTAPAVTITTSDSDNWIVMGSASLGNAGIPTSNTGTLRNANRTGSTSSNVAGASCDNTVSVAGSLKCQVTISSGVWAAAAVELRSIAAPTSYQWPNCDTSHPCMIHEVSTVTDGTTESNNAYKLRFQPSKANNAIGLVVTHLDTKTISSITIDSGDSFGAAVVTTDNATDATKSELFVKCGATTGASEITVTFSAAMISGDIVHFHYFEMAGVPTTSCTDGSSGANGLTASPFQPGSITTTVNGDVIYNFAITSYPFPTSEVPQGPVTPSGPLAAMVAQNTVSKYAVQMQYQAALGAINPALYINDQFLRRWNSLAVAFKTSVSTGTLPSTMNVNHITHYYFPASLLVSAALPSTGDLLIVATTNADDLYAVTNLRDHNANTYTRPTHAALDGQIFYSCSSTSGTDLTYSWSAQNLATHLVLYDVSGGATGGSTACYDTVASASGSGVGAGVSITNAPTITPTTSNGVIFNIVPFGTGSAICRSH
jgi:hypothetical protein